jgi:thioesterase domain-containing protein
VFGNVVGYADLCLGLGSEQPFYGLQSVGVDGKEAPLDSIEEMAKLYIREIRSVQLHGPYALIGVCFGGTVAYEMARQLLEAGHEVAFLGLLDPARREADEDGKSTVWVPLAVKRAKVLGSFLTARLQLYLAEIRGLDSGARIKFITSKIRTLSSKIQSKRGFRGVQREIHQLAVYRANVFALDHYHRKPLQGRLRSLEIFETARSRNTAMPEPFDWTVFWKGPTTRHLLPGKDSGDMISGKNARVLATLLAERLRAAFNQESTKKSKLPTPNESPTFLNLDRGYAD